MNSERSVRCAQDDKRENAEVILGFVRRPVVFLLAAALGCGLWFGKNWVLTGNPTYPLLYEVFDGKTWTAEKQQQWNHVHRPHDFSAETLGKDLGRVVLTSEWLSPLIVPLAVLAFVGAVGQAVVCHARGRQACLPPSALVWGLLAYVGFVIAVWWLLTHRIDRFWIPVLPVVALLAGAGAAGLRERWWRILLPVLLVAGLGANFLVASTGQGNAWFVSLARLRHDPAWIDPWHEYFNTHLTAGRLLLVGDAAVFDLTVPVLYNTCFDDCIFEQLVRGKTAAEVRAELAARQIAYVYVNWGEIARYRPGTYGFTDFVQPEVFDRLVAAGRVGAVAADRGPSGTRIPGEDGTRKVGQRVRGSDFVRDLWTSPMTQACHALPPSPFRLPAFLHQTAIVRSAVNRISYGTLACSFLGGGASGKTASDAWRGIL